MVVRWPAQPSWPADSALDFSARACAHLFLRVLFSALPDQRADWPGRNSACPGFPAGCGRTDGPDPLLVRADSLLVFQQLCGTDDDYVGRACGVGDRVSESLAAALFFRVFPLLPFVHRRVECVLELSIGWHVARGGIHRAVFCSARIDAGMGRARSAIAREPVPAAMGVVPDLLRIGHGEAAERRRGVAQLYSDGRVLPERPAAHLGRLVRATPAALVPRSNVLEPRWRSNWGSSS